MRFIVLLFLLVFSSHAFSLELQIPHVSRIQTQSFVFHADRWIVYRNLQLAAPEDFDNTGSNEFQHLHGFGGLSSFCLAHFQRPVACSVIGSFFGAASEKLMDKNPDYTEVAFGYATSYELTTRSTLSLSFAGMQRGAVYFALHFTW